MEIFNFCYVNCFYSIKIVYNDFVYLILKYIFIGFCCGYKDFEFIIKVFGI